MAVMIVFTILILSSGCSSTAKEPPTPSPLPTAPAFVKPTYAVQRGEVIGQVRFSGSIAPVEQRTVFFRTNGRIRKVYVQKGDTVKAGQVLVDLEDVDSLERQLKMIQLAYHRAQINAEIARLTLELFKETTHDYTAGYDTQLAIKERELELANIALEEASTDILGVQEAITNTKVIAPMAGMVISLDASEGREVRVYQPVAIVGDTTQLEVSADVPGDLLNKLSVGMSGTIVPILGMGREMTGKIRRIPGSVSSSGLMEEDQSTRVLLDGSAIDLGYELGERVYVNVVLQRQTDTLWIPPQVIRTFGGRVFVVVQENGVQRRVDVKIGVEGEDRVEILEGLAEGQVVVSP